jgi:CIC family chloride channel protein
VENASRFGSRLQQRLTRRLSSWLDCHQPPETAVLMGTSLLVGIGAGLGVVVFRWLIDAVYKLGYEGLGVPGNYWLVLVPALGGLIVGPLIYFLAREAKGHSVPEVMEAVALRGGRIRPIVKEAPASAGPGSKRLPYEEV